MTLEKYIHSLGLLMDDVKVDQKGRLFILIEGTEDCNHVCDSNCRMVGCNCKCGEFHESDKVAFYKEIGIPEEYQTLHNVGIVTKVIKE